MKIIDFDINPVFSPKYLIFKLKTRRFNRRIKIDLRKKAYVTIFYYQKSKTDDGPVAYRR